MFRSSTEDLVTCWQRCCRERAASCRVYRRCQSLRVRGKTVQCPPGLTCRRFLEQQQQQLEVVRDEISQPVIQQLITLLSDLEPSEKWPWPRPVILIFSKLPSGKQICAIVVKLSCGQSHTSTYLVTNFLCRVTSSAHLVVGPSLSLDQRLGIRCRLTSVIRRVVTSLSDVHSKHFCFCSLSTCVSSALEVFLRRCAI